MKNGAMTSLSSFSASSYLTDSAISFLTRYAPYMRSSVALTHLMSQVVAPVRETVSQTLASLLLHMPRRSALRVHEILLEMIRQDFPIPTKPANGALKGRPAEKGHIWEVRHAGLLGIKYEVAVRSDLVGVKDGEDGAAGQHVLRGVVDAAVLG